MNTSDIKQHLRVLFFRPNIRKQALLAQLHKDPVQVILEPCAGKNLAFMRVCRPLCTACTGCTGFFAKFLYPEIIYFQNIFHFKISPYHLFNFNFYF